MLSPLVALGGRQQRQRHETRGAQLPIPRPCASRPRIHGVGGGHNASPVEPMPLPLMVVTRYTESEWYAEATKRFGSNSMGWRFTCPICGVITSVQEWKDAGAPEGAVASSCIGRYTTANRKAFGTTPDKIEGPCNYTGGGLFRLNPVTVVRDGSGIEESVFDFAPMSEA